ncbi:hypothetical protein KJB23_19590, partial [Serratia marcescens]|uniref:hypothetical protein n=1 Tax=Serratia marcescens TaxID=615 RepID=UPI001BDC07C1
QADITNTLSAAWGGAYINDFIDRGRGKRGFMEGGAAGGRAQQKQPSNVGCAIFFSLYPF